MIARTCKQCGKLFSSISREICPECMNQEKEQYRVVEKCLRENPGISLMDICEQTGVDERIVLKFIKEGRLKGMDQSFEIKCETCGKLIMGGRLCPTCMEKLSAGLKASAPAKDEGESEKKGMLSKRTKEE